jgi:hypothetical protein
MVLSNWGFAATFAAAVAGCLIVLLVVWVRRSKQGGQIIRSLRELRLLYCENLSGGRTVTFPFGRLRDLCADCYE